MTTTIPVTAVVPNYAIRQARFRDWHSVRDNSYTTTLIRRFPTDAEAMAAVRKLPDFVIWSVGQ